MLRSGKLANNFTHKGSKVLLTEGKNDCFVILALCEYYKIPKAFGLHDCGQDDLVLKELNARITGANPIEVIGVVIDADKPDLAGRWQQIRDKFKSKLPIPNFPDPVGTILPATDDYPKIGFWLMPDNNLDGMLEDFCAKLADSKSIDFAEQCVNQAESKKHASFKDVHKAKAVIHTFLAWQDEPGRPLGQAITARTLNPENPIANDFVAWLRKLFV